ncbi:MAG: 30S ribosome-binding factor RbfA [Coriobacteriales bacterium]|jgi:ribosome-binding factor A
MKQTPASRKSNQIIKDKIATIILTQCADPRLDMITVTDAKVSNDRSVCNIYVSTEPDRYDEVRSGLAAANGRIRSILGKTLGWRVTPELRFMIDETVDQAERIEKALLDVPATMSIPKDEDGNPIPVEGQEAPEN